MYIPIRHHNPNQFTSLYGCMLALVDQQERKTMPGLRITLKQGLTQTHMVMIRLYTKAGIAIATSQLTIPTSTTQIDIYDLVLLGLDAYQHVSYQERLAVAWRMCSRVAYASIT